MSVLVDTSVWVNQLRTFGPDRAALLNQSRVLMHPWVYGELALGGATRKPGVSVLLGALPQAPLASVAKVKELIHLRLLHGRGIGYVDAQLLASTALAQGSTLWTTDRELEAATKALGLAHQD